MLVVANWKMNPLSVEEAKQLFSTISQKEEVVICPPCPFLYLGKNFVLGGQNCSNKKEGSLTGEVSAFMLNSIGCKYVIVGHSERRVIMKETDDIINIKALMAIDAKLTPIICVGEINKSNKGEEIERQLKIALNGINKDVVVAYEPIFAIGTGNPCSIDVANERRELIKNILKEKGLEKSLVLYGGSVNSENVSFYTKQAGFDGVLVGKASLDANEFNKIIENALCSRKS